MPADTAPAWTKGPWHYVPSNEHHGPYVTGDYGSDIADCYTMSLPSFPSTRNGGPSKPVLFMGEMADANARLIAAAPEMWEALVGLLTHFRKPRRDEWMNDTAWKLACDAVARAEAVVAKAEGRE